MIFQEGIETHEGHSSVNLGSVRATVSSVPSHGLSCPTLFLGILSGSQSYPAACLHHRYHFSDISSRPSTLHPIHTCHISAIPCIVDSSYLRMRRTATNTSLTLLRANGSSVSLINDSSPLHYQPIQALSLPAASTLPFVLHDTHGFPAGHTTT